MAHFDDLVLFAHIAELGSFTETAKRLGLAKSAVSKQITRLEKNLGARLLHRTTRQLSLTEAGNQVLPHAQRIIEELNGIDDAVSGLQSKPTGTLRVSAPVAAGNRYLASLVPQFQQLYPDVDLLLSLNDRHVDIAAEGFDLGIRLTSSPPENWQARKLKSIVYRICATPEYWHKHKLPQSPEDLEKHACLFNKEPQHQRWRLRQAGEEWQEANVAGKLIINTSEGLRAAVLQSTAIALLPEYTIENDIQAGRLQIAFQEYEIEGPFGDAIYALYLPNRYLAPKTRAFIDFLATNLSSDE